MNFQNLMVVRTHDEYLDSAFGLARKDKLILKGITSQVNRARKVEINKLTIINEYLYHSLDNIIKKFPRVDKLPIAYQKLFPCYLDVDEYKRHLGAIRWGRQRVSQLSNVYGKKIKTCTDAKEISDMGKSFYGRVSSVLKKISDSFIILEQLRKQLKDLPDIKEEFVNVVIFGFPNVGKSTLLAKLTTAKPQIGAYAFTTTKINMGYSGEFQIFDTPGTLNRFEKMNLVEKQAYIMATELAHLIIYVFDPTESYPLADQEKLFLNIQKLAPNAQIITYCSKSDIANIKDVEYIKKKFNCKEISELLLHKNKAFSRQFTISSS